MARILPISEVKARLPELVSGVEGREEEIVVTRKGKPAAVLVNHAEYERLKETVDVLSDRDLMRQIRLSRRFYAARRRGLSFGRQGLTPSALPGPPRTADGPGAMRAPPSRAGLNADPVRMDRCLQPPSRRPS